MNILYVGRNLKYSINQIIKNKQAFLVLFRQKVIFLFIIKRKENKTQTKNQMISYQWQLRLWQLPQPMEVESIWKNKFFEILSIYIYISLGS